jgi:N-acetylglutamate synthase-like GNAT family acetyltransferase
MNVLNIVHGWRHLVDPDHTGSGVGSALVNSAAEIAFDLGHSPVYLCATQKNSGFYPRLGWKCIENNVNGLNIFKRSNQQRS